jgi:hypothetical protein
MLRALVTTVLVGTLVAPAAARAATLTSDRACYRESQIMQLTVTGFPSGEGVGFRGNDAPLRAAYGSDGQEGFLMGDGTIGIQAPFYDAFTTGPLHLVADASVTGPDGEQQTTSATADVRLIDDFHGFSQPAAARPNRVVTYVVAGAVELKPVYLHVYRELSTGRSRKRIRRDFLLGTPKGPCGSLRVRMREAGTMPIVRHAEYSRTIDLTPHGRATVDDQHPAANLQPVFTR